MRRVVPALLIAARVLGILAVLALLFTLWGEFILWGLTCADNCSTPEQYFNGKVPSALFFLGPCIVLAALALALFLVYCLATRQARRAIVVLLFFLVGGFLGVAALTALVEYGRATVPVDVETSLLIERQVVDWARQWALAILLIAVVWSGGLACLEWGHRWDRLDQRSSS
jgi:hypothetical protein